AVRLISAAGQLHAVHTQVGMGGTGPVGILRIHLRQRDEGAPVTRPALELRQSINGRLPGEDRTPRNQSGTQIPERERNVSKAPRPLPEGGWVYLEFDQLPHRSEHIAE